MYNQINTHAQTIVSTIPAYHVNEYDWLIHHLDQCSTSDYQTRYKTYWRLGAARLSAGYGDAYFKALQAARRKAPSVTDLAMALYASPTHKNGKKSLQFSFATKLVHMVNPAIPVYDSLVAAFYFFRDPPRKLPIAQRVGALGGFHAFLQSEYDRVLKHHLLAQAITCFRQTLKPQHFTDEKVVDSLIWAYVATLWDGGITKGVILYQ